MVMQLSIQRQIILLQRALLLRYDHFQDIYLKQARLLLILNNDITFCTLYSQNTLNKPIILEDTSTTITQAKAARIHADKCVFFDCAFLGVQDTLYDDDGRHYYRNCYIQGGSDFIYGNGQSIFEVS